MHKENSNKIHAEKLTVADQGLIVHHYSTLHLLITVDLNSDFTVPCDELCSGKVKVIIQVTLLHCNEMYVLVDITV
jgi:hypothetical protein